MEEDGPKRIGSEVADCNSHKLVENACSHRKKDSTWEDNCDDALLSWNSTSHKTLFHRDDSGVFVGNRKRSLDNLHSNLPVRQEPRAELEKWEDTSSLSGVDDATRQETGSSPHIHLHSNGTPHTRRRRHPLGYNVESKERHLCRREDCNESSSGHISCRHVRAL